MIITKLKNRSIIALLSSLFFITIYSQESRLLCLPDPIISEIFEYIVYADPFRKAAKTVDSLYIVNKKLKKRCEEIFLRKKLLNKLATMTAINFANVENPAAASEKLFDIACSSQFFFNSHSKISDNDQEFINKFTLRFLKRMGGDIHGIYQNNSLLSYVTEFHSNTSFAVLLLEQGVNPDRGNTSSKITPLMLARLHGKANMFELLLKYGADITLRDVSGNTLFSGSYNHRNGLSIEIVEFLIKCVKEKKIKKV